MFFVSSLPVFYQDWGGREAIMVFSMSDLGPVTTVQSVALSITFFVVIFASFFLPGATFWMMRPSM